MSAGLLDGKATWDELDLPAQMTTVTRGGRRVSIERRFGRVRSIRGCEYEPMAVRVATRGHLSACCD
jgi:hypothetical protein